MEKGDRSQLSTHSILDQGVGTTVIRASLLTSAQMASYDESKHLLLDYLSFQDNFFTHFCAR